MCKEHKKDDLQTYSGDEEMSEDGSDHSFDLSIKHNSINEIRLNQLRNIEMRKINKLLYEFESYYKKCKEFIYFPNIENGKINFPIELETGAAQFLFFLKGEKCFTKTSPYGKEDEPGVDVTSTNYAAQCKYHADGVSSEEIRKFNGTLTSSTKEKELFFFASSYKRIRKGYEHSLSEVQLFEVFNCVNDGKFAWSFVPVNVSSLIIN